jgi:HAD superfamily hydrolase (TIGR01549 family)
MKKKLFCFDFDDTLVDEDYWFKARWNKTFELHQSLFTTIIIKDFFDIYDLKGPYYKFHLQDLSLHHKEIKLSKKQIINTFKSIEVKEILFPEVFNALSRLSSVPNYKIGIISNGSYNVLIKRLKHLNIYNFFDTIICDGYMKKPNNESFQTIFKNYKDYELFYIGNDIRLDLIPANENGFKTFLYVKDKTRLNSKYNCFSDYLSFSNQFL